jgi:hypothetical protein
LNEYFPKKLHHNSPESIICFRNIPLTIFQKGLIHSELQRGVVSQKTIASYLQVNVHRIEKLEAAVRNKIPFHEEGCRPTKIDEEGKASIRHEIIKRKDKMKPML